MRLDKSKRIRSALLLFGLGLSDVDILTLFNEHELVVESIKKVKKAEQEAFAARAAIFKSTNPGDRPTPNSINSSISNILFNKVRYDLSETGRYKISKKLNPTSRILNRVLVEDVKDAKGNTVAKANTVVTEEVANKIYDL